MDYGEFYTKTKILEIERRLTRVYSEASRDIDRKMNDFFERYKKKESIYLKKLDDGEITQADFDDWKKGQVFQGEMWRNKKKQIADTLYNANSTATQIINGYTSGVFATNANFISYSLEKAAKADFGFGVYNAEAVSNLIKNEPNLIVKSKVLKSKDEAWNMKKITRQVTQGIIQGEKLSEVADRLAKVTSSQNKSSMMTHASMALGAAQNSGRLYQMEKAEKLGIKVKKEWMATLDSRTRDSHAAIDGEKVPLNKPFSNGLMYPKDPNGRPEEVYNCRCTMVTEFEDYPDNGEYERYDNISGKPIENVTYKEWEKTKLVTHKVANKVMGLAKDAEKKVTRDLTSAVNMGSGELSGLDFKFKGRGSLERKIVDKSAKKGLTQEEYGRQITDALRYTSMSDPDHLTEDYFIVKNSLEKKGYSMVEVVNTLGDKEAEYRGINTLVKTPNGYTFELQFHTPESFYVKDKVNHKLYEEQRKAGTSEKRKEELAIQMLENSARIETPKNIEDIVNKVLDKKILQW